MGTAARGMGGTAARGCLLVAAIVALLSGCYCRSCNAQSLSDRGPFAAASRQIDATAYQEFVEVCSAALKGASGELGFFEELYRTMTNQTGAPTGDALHTATSGQWNTGFRTDPIAGNPAQSLVARLYRRLARESYARGRPGPTPYVLRNAHEDAPLIYNATKAARIQARIGLIEGADVEAMD